MALLTEEKQYQWEKGSLYDSYEFLGAHVQSNAVTFRVWAPHAKQVHVVGDFNNWETDRDALTKIGTQGFWERTVKEIAEPGQYYKYAVTGPAGTTVLKADPYAFLAEQGTYHASVIYDFPDFNWSDDQWMNERAGYQQPDQPIAIYEVHLGSWKHDKQGDPLTYRQLARQLIPYVKKMGFTHIELLPIMEHPYTPSWGYQITGYFAPTSRYGQPEDFMAFIDECHKHNIGVILDWVPGHFPKDEHGLRFFDGTALFEHANPRRHVHADWGTHNFDFEKPAVRNFLLSNAHFWCTKYHVDGFRVDAVASMLYLNYSKGEGEWLPNKHGGTENLGAINFIHEFNQLIERYFPSVMTIAEESTAWNGVTTSVEDGGLGFDYKWNMGWMNDTLTYFQESPEKRLQHSHQITFPRTFAFSERFILSFSHDEVVHLKKSLWSKMPGNSDEKIAQLRLLYFYMMAYPGKKLLFMGGELAEKQEWADSGSLHWELLDNLQHKNIQQYVQNLLALYRSEPALYETDHNEESFEWIDLSHKDRGIFSFRRTRKADECVMIFIFNFSGNEIPAYPVTTLLNKKSVLCFDTCEEQNFSLLPVKNHSSVPLKPFQGLFIKTDPSN